MKKLFPLLLSVLFSLPVLAQTAALSKKVPLKVTKFGVTFDDDYTWLEKSDAKEVQAWVEAENQATDAQLAVIKDKYDIASKLREYDNLSTNPLPAKKGRYFYSNYRVDKNRPSSVYVRKKLIEKAVEIANPYKLYKDNNAYITDYTPSNNSRYLAFQVSVNGSDRHDIRFADIDKATYLPDSLTNVKFSNMAWNGDKGIFYKKNANLSVFAKDSTYQLFYHKLGKPQSEDELVYDASKTEAGFGFFTKENKLFVMERNKAETSANFYYSPIDTETFYLQKFIDNDVSGMKFWGYLHNRVYFSSTDYDWGELRSFDIDSRKDETVVIPQLYNNLLVDVDFYDNYIVCKYKTLGKNFISVYDSKGTFIRRFDAPQGMDFNIRFYDPETKELFVSFYSYVLSFHNFRLNIETGESHSFYTDFAPPKATLFPLDYFETKTITYKSRDNTDIPMTIVYKKNLVLDGNNPTLLNAYGGFGVVSRPVFDTGLLYFLEKGGVFAYAEIRGGGEKGRKWHTEGKGLKKMNTFNDFIDAAEFLIKEKYTSPGRLAITGGSQGGLLVGVAMTQRPELFKVAIPKMGAFDMIKYPDYTVGKFHLDEYGDPDKEAGFNSLLSYSPYHNIKEGVNYPTTLIITSENDDRVPPIHSFKFAARLQNREAQKNPIFLKTLSNSGH